MIQQGPEERPATPDKLLQFTCCLVIAGIVVSGLAFGSALLLPAVEALIIWFILNSLAASLQRLPRVGPHLGPMGAKVIAISLMVCIALAAVYSGVRGVMNAGPQAIGLQSSLDPIVGRIAAVFGTDEAAVLDRVFEAIGLENLMQQVVLGLVGLINQSGIIAIYVAFLFADQAFFDRKMQLLFPDAAKRVEAQALLEEIAHGISSYLWIMTRISALTAGLSYLAMVIMGLEYPIFWALLVFFLNFIPTIGSILGTVLPTAFALVQFPGLESVAILGVMLGVIQITMGNIVFPRMAGNSLNLSLFVTIFCLFLWGTIWGVTGMFLAVPLTAMLLIILAQFRATRPLSILLSKTGDVSVFAEPSQDQ